MTAVFFGVSASTIAIVLRVGDGETQVVFWVSAIACLVTSIVNIRQTVIVAGMESHHDYELLLYSGGDSTSLKWLIRLQTLVAALVGSVLGFIVGASIVTASLPWLRTLDGGGLDHASLNWSWWSAPVVIIGGLAAGMAAAWGPSRTAGRDADSDASTVGNAGSALNPRADRRAAHRTRVRDSIRLLAGTGILTIGAGLAVLDDGDMMTALGASALIVIGFFIAFPVAFTGLFRALDDASHHWPHDRLLVLKYAVRSIAVRDRTAAAVATAFTVGVMFLGGVTVTGSWNSDADSMAAAAGYAGTLKINNKKSGSTPDEFRDSDVAAWASMDGVTGVYEFQGEVLIVNSNSDDSDDSDGDGDNGLDSESLGKSGAGGGVNDIGDDNQLFLYRVRTVEGDNPFRSLMVGDEDAAVAFENGDAVIGDKDASKYKLGIGDEVTISNRFMNGVMVRVRIGAVTTTGYTKNGIFINDTDAYPLDHATSVYIVTSNPDDPNDTAFVRRWTALYGDDYVGQDRESRIKQFGAPALQTLLVDYAAACLVITVSVLGLLTMMSLSIMQRKRELGLLSAYGMSARSIRRTLLVEAAMITGVAGLAAAVVGSVIGVIIGGAMIGGGAFPWLLVSWLVVASIIVGILAAMVPGMVAVRSSASELRDE